MSDEQPKTRSQVIRESNIDFMKKQEEREKKELAGWDPEKRTESNPAMGITFPRG